MSASAHIDVTQVRRGTPESALRSIRPEDGGVDAIEKTVSIEETSVGSERYNIDPDLTASGGVDGNGSTPPASGTTGRDDRTPPPTA